MMFAIILCLPVLGAVIAPLAGKKKGAIRDLLLRLFTLAELMLLLYVFLQTVAGKEMALQVSGLCGMDLSFRADGFRAMYALLAAFMWFIAAMFSKQYFSHGENHGRYAFFTLLTLCGVMGVFLSDDLYTTFVFFEIMSIASYPWVAHEENKGAMRAAATYLGVSIACGMVTLMGMMLCYHRIGDLSFAGMRNALGKPEMILPACLMLVGYCAKAGLAPLHIWLPKAHPVAPAPSSALLSGMLTKTGLFGVLVIGLNLIGENRVFGHVMLVLGLFTMFLGALLAVFSINLKRTLACSSLSQIGYITVGFSCVVLLGHHGALAAAGTVGHMINHSLLKLALFLGAGAVYMCAHSLDLSKLMGFGRKKPLLHAVFLLGGMGLSGVPMLNGYASKTMIHEAMVELIHEYPGVFSYHVAEWVFLFAAGLTTAYMLKIYICMFWQKNPDAALQAEYDGMKHEGLQWRSALALGIAIIPLLVIGLFPNQTLLWLTNLCAPFLHQHTHGAVHFLAWVNLKGGLISLAIGTAVYFLFVRTALYKKEVGYVDIWPKKLDLEEIFYRPVFCRFLPWLGCTVASFVDHLAESKLFSKILPNFFVGLFRLMDELLDHMMLLIREFFLIDRQEMRREGQHGVIVHMASAIVEGVHRFLVRILPERWMSHKLPTDMRYGTYVTNAISFGLLLCALGIIVAILYVFIKVGG